MRVIFRVDASEKIGNGHFYRCLSLAEGLIERGAETQFICKDLDRNLNDLLKDKSIPVLSLINTKKKSELNNESYADWLGISQKEDAEETICALQGSKPDYLIVDHYALDAKWEGQIKKHVKRLILIDDLAEKQHLCDIVINQGYFSAKEDYLKLIPENCQLLLGPDYVLLSAAYKQALKKMVVRQGKLEHLLIFFTAGDDNGETLKALKGLSQGFKFSHVDVVVGKNNYDSDDIKNICIHQGWQFHCQIDYMAELILEADLVIGSAGANSWERCVLGAPALVTIMADNQQANATALEKMNAIVCIGDYKSTSPETYRNALLKINNNKLQAMSSSAGKLIDTNGVDRICDYLLSDMKH